MRVLHVSALALAGLHRHDAWSAAGAFLRHPRLGQREGTDGGVGADDRSTGCTGCTCRDPTREPTRPRRASHRPRRPAGTGRPRSRRRRTRAALSPSMRATGSMIVADHAPPARRRPSMSQVFGAVLGVGPVGGHVDLHVGGGAGVNGLVVHVHDVLRPSSA